jgi:hypothetical protein
MPKTRAWPLLGQVAEGASYIFPINTLPQIATLYHSVQGTTVTCTYCNTYAIKDSIIVHSATYGSVVVVNWTNCVHNPDCINSWEANKDLLLYKIYKDIETQSASSGCPLFTPQDDGVPHIRVS